MLAIIRRRLCGQSLEELDETYPTAASQRDVVQVIEAAGIVAQKNYRSLQAGLGIPVTARLTDSEIQILAVPPEIDM